MTIIPCISYPTKAAGQNPDRVSFFRSDLDEHESSSAFFGRKTENEVSQVASFFSSRVALTS